MNNYMWTTNSRSFRNFEFSHFLPLVSDFVWFLQTFPRKTFREKETEVNFTAIKKCFKSACLFAVTLWPRKSTINSGAAEWAGYVVLKCRLKCILNRPLPIGAFQEQCKQTMINKYSNKHYQVKNPYWREAHYSAIYECSRKVELGATENNIS